MILPRKRSYVLNQAHRYLKKQRTAICYPSKFLEIRSLMPKNGELRAKTGTLIRIKSYRKRFSPSGKYPYRPTKTDFSAESPPHVSHVTCSISQNQRLPLNQRVLIGWWREASCPVSGLPRLRAPHVTMEPEGFLTSILEELKAITEAFGLYRERYMEL